MPDTYPKNVDDYLRNKTYTRWELEWDFKSDIENVVVVPAICEYENIKCLLSSLLKNEPSQLQKTLIIFVINHSISSSSEIKEDNKKSLIMLREIINRDTNDPFVKDIISSLLNVGLIDAATEGKEFTDKEAGVGLARKIGMDKALVVFDYSLPSKKIIICLDADCTVENNYLSEINKSFNDFNLSVATVEFEHNLSITGILAYEIFLRHYVIGLKYAQSSYAYHTIGSTIVCDHEAYIKAGGMNTKPAAEDFYFLQKLAKMYSIAKIDSTVVRPSARESWRVPFGTGRSMMDYNSDKKNILVYDPDEYLILKHWLNLLNSDLVLNTDIVLKEAKKIHTELFNFLEMKDFRKDWDKILLNSRSEKQLSYQRKNWFDAFKTFKLIHHLRDTDFPMMNVKTGTKKLFEMLGYSQSTEPDLESYLIELRKTESQLSKNILKQYS
jgi:hypothetical protein